MTKRFIQKVFPLLAILVLVAWSAAYAQSYSSDITGQDIVQIALAEPSVASGLTSVQGPSPCCSYPVSQIRDYVENYASQGFDYQRYVTPEDPAVEALAACTNGARDAYEVAVQWTYVSDQKLNHVANKWLTLHEFLTNTPQYPGNPVKGKEVSDCEEQAHALVSLIRAEGIRPEEVRVALGEVKFGDGVTPHAWVELLTNGHWVALEPGCGPYWDDKDEKLVSRRGLPFDYYASHTYPVVQVWAYYNDIYYFDPRDSSGNAPASWR